ncbi:unnamed protein product [Camellia sinensis]
MGTKLQNTSNPIDRSTITKVDSFGVSCWDHSAQKLLLLVLLLLLLLLLSSTLRSHQWKGGSCSINTTLNLSRRQCLYTKIFFNTRVRELHRLYSVQKMLMDEMRNNKIKQEMYWGVPRIDSNCSNYSNLLINRHQPTTTTGGTEYNNLHVQRVMTTLPDNTERSSSSCCGETPRIPKGFDLDLDLERPAQEEEEEEEEDNISSTTGGVVSASKTYRAIALKNKDNNNHIDIGKEDGYDDETEVELTLSIGGGCCREKKSETKCHQ